MDDHTIYLKNVNILARRNRRIKLDGAVPKFDIVKGEAKKDEKVITIDISIGDDVKTDSRTMMQLVVALNKFLYEHEEEILNG